MSSSYVGFAPLSDDENVYRPYRVPGAQGTWRGIPVTHLFMPDELREFR